MDPHSLMAQEPVEDLMGREPAWLVRFGVSLVFMIFALLVALTWWLQYPQTLEADITLSSERPPAEVAAKTDGVMIQLFVHDHDQVTAGVPLALLDNTADFQAVRALTAQLQQFSPFFDNPLAFEDISWKKEAQLGDLQSAYLTFIRTLEQYHFFRDTNAFGKSMAAAQRQQRHYQQLQAQLQQQVRTATAQLAFEDENLKRSRRLLRRSILARTDLIEAENAYLERQSALEDANILLVRNQIRRAEIDQQLVDFQRQQSAQEASILVEVKVAYKNLRHALDEWTTRYVLTSPADGRVAFHKFWSRDQYVTRGDVIMSVVAEATEVVGKMYLPQYGVGKLQLGQSVDVRLDSYPHTEFGRVVGEVERVSPLAIEKKYLIQVRFANGLITTYQKRLPFTHHLQGQARIVTEERRLIERIFEHFRYLFSS